MKRDSECGRAGLAARFLIGTILLLHGALMPVFGVLNIVSPANGQVYCVGSTIYITVSHVCESESPGEPVVTFNGIILTANSSSGGVYSYSTPASFSSAAVEIAASAGCDDDPVSISVKLISLTGVLMSEGDHISSDGGSASYAIFPATSGSVSVTAQLYPDASATELSTANGWSYSGGSGTAKVRTFNKPATGGATSTATFTAYLTSYPRVLCFIGIQSVTVTGANMADTTSTTETWVSGKGLSGDVIITATPTHGLTEAQLAGMSGWTASGGNGTAKLTRTISKTIAMENAPVTFYCGAEQSKSTTIKVIEVGATSAAGATLVSTDPDHKVYIVAKAASGSVTIQAEPNPTSVSASELSLSGWYTLSYPDNTGNELLTRNVSKSTVGTTKITFSTGTASTKDVTVHIVEFHSQTEATQPQNRLRTKLGVGEVVNVWIEPTTIAPDNTISWSASEGTISCKPASSYEANFTAPDIESQSVYISAIINGVTIFGLSFSVVAPQTVTIELADPPDNHIYHIENTVSCGFWGKVYIGPDDVSFYRVSIREGYCLAVAEGYLEYLNNLVHPMGNWKSLTETVAAGKGTRVSTLDKIQQVAITNIPLASGTFVWEIPWHYIINGEPNEFARVTQRVDTDETGKCTITKAGYDKSRNYSDPTDQEGW